MHVFPACPGGAATPCNNDGTCSDSKNGTGVCTCQTGFTGNNSLIKWPVFPFKLCYNQATRASSANPAISVPTARRVRAVPRSLAPVMAPVTTASPALACARANRALTVSHASYASLATLAPHAHHALVAASCPVPATAPAPTSKKAAAYAPVEPGSTAVPASSVCRADGVPTAWVSVVANAGLQTV